MKNNNNNNNNNNNISSIIHVVLHARKNTNTALTVTSHIYIDFVCEFQCISQILLTDFEQVTSEASIECLCASVFSDYIDRLLADFIYSSDC